MPFNTETSKPSTSTQHKTSSKSNVKRGSDETLFETLMSDPIKKAFLLNLLKNEKENIKKYKEQELKSPAVKKKRLYCESPTALLRRRALEKNVEQRSRSNSCSPVSSSIPFSQLLKGVVAYVDIKSKGIDRSSGAKTLMESMGAKVAERLERGVTHVIFKDSSFLTYQKAKLLKAHLVSVLWLEAVRKFNCRVPEKNYPALGTEAYDVNVSEIFQEYESVVNEEYRRSMAFNNKKKSRLTALPSELSLSQNKNVSFSRRMSSIVPSSQDYEVESIISSRSICSSRTNSEINHMNDETSDNDSECGLINGNSFSQLKRSLLFDLEHQLNDYEERANPRSENVLENLFHEGCDKNSEPAKMNRSNIARLQSDILANNDRSVSTSSSRSASLLSRKSIVSDKTSNTTAEMDLTNIARRTPEKSFKRKTLHLGDESIFDHKSKKKRQSMPVTNNSSQSSHSCIELSGTPLSAPTDLEVLTDTVSVPVDTAKNQIESRDLSTSDPQVSAPSQLKEVPLQNNLKKSSNDARGELIHRSKNSDTMTTLTVSKDSENGFSTRRSSKLSSSEIKNKSCENLESLKVNKNSDDFMSPLRISADSAPIVGSLRKSLRLSQSVPNVLLLQRQESSGVNKKLSIQKSSRFNTISCENDSSNSKTNDCELKRINVRRSSRFTGVNAKSNATDRNLDENFKSSRRTKSSTGIAPSLELTDESSENHLAETSSEKRDPVTNARSRSTRVDASSGFSPGENDLEPEANKTKRSDVVPDLITGSSLQKNTNLDRLSKSCAELTNNPIENRMTESSSKKSNNLVQGKDVRRSSRFRVTNTNSTVSQIANSLEGDLEANKSKNVDALSLTTRNRKSTKSGPSTEENGSRQSARLTKSSSEIFEKPLDSRNSKSSEAMSSLRISEDNASNRRSFRSSQSKSEVTLSAAAKENIESRRSLRRSTMSKNSETMPSLRISSESALSKSPRLDRNDHIKNTKTDDRPTSKKGKKVRKLFNVNQSASQIQELANTDNGNKEVFALPIPVISPNAKTLIVPLTRMVFPGKQKNFKRRPQTQDSSNKEPVSATTPVQRKRKIVETINQNPNPADNADDEYQNTSLTVQNVSLLQTQLAATGSRRSTLEFIDKPLPRRKIQKEKRVQTGIVCTRMHKPEVEFFMETVKKLGSFYVEDEVSENTTHLVVGESKRTINLLKAIGRGCWILTKNWLQKSVEAGKWVEEEDYELVNFSPAVKQCRMEKQAFGDLYSMDIFKECLPIYISKQTNPKRTDLIELIKLGKGTITRQINDAKIIIGDCINREGVKCVTEKWVLDSISFNKRKGFSKYLIRNRC